MVRWEPGSSGRLARAALALFGESASRSTTVAAIAERAGVTERTFFRHFADKREVLFGGAARFQDTIVAGVGRRALTAPAGGGRRWRRRRRRSA